MFFEAPGKHPGVEPVFSEKDEAINPHLKRESQPDVNGCKTLCVPEMFFDAFFECVQAAFSSYSSQSAN
jgi:hypothetical protein